MRIINEAKLPYEVIGQIIDKYINDGEGCTFYYGKVDWFKFKYEKNIYNMEVTYLKRYVVYRVWKDKE